MPYFQGYVLVTDSVTVSVETLEKVVVTCINVSKYSR
jgi:hypothetical protein